jgi:hypothetical protein
MAKDTFWFRHDSNARNDHKLIKLRRLRGLEGLGLYWCLVEILRESPGYKFPLAAVEDLEYELRFERPIFDSIVDCGLLEFTNEGEFFSPSLLTRMERWDGIRAKKAESGRKGGKAKAKAKQTPSERQAERVANPSDEMRGDEKRGDERRGDKKDSPEPTRVAPEKRLEMSRLEEDVLSHLKIIFNPRISELKAETAIRLAKNLADPIYSGVDILGELRKAAIWEDSNPTRRKTARGLPRFLTSWMERAQNRGGRPAQGPMSAADRNFRDSMEALQNFGKGNPDD